MSATHTLPDGKTFTLEQGEGRDLGEALLDPDLAGLPNSMPLADAIFSSCACHLESATRRVGSLPPMQWSPVLQARPSTYQMLWEW